MSLRGLVAWALRARLAVLALSALMAAIGVWAFITLPIDAFPDISTTQVKIILRAPGMTPEEVEARVITPIETEMLGIPDQTTLRSVAKYAIADITIDFRDSTDIYWARSQVAERLNSAMSNLPAGVEGGLSPISTPLSDMYMFTIEGPQSLAERRRVLDWVIRPALRTVPGVADVNALGGFVETYEVRPDNAALAAAGLTTADLAQAIERNNRNDGPGRLQVGEQALIVRTVGAVRSLADMGAIVVQNDGGRIVRVSDVATVASGSLTRYGAVTRNGRGGNRRRAGHWPARRGRCQCCCRCARTPCRSVGQPADRHARRPLLRPIRLDRSRGWHGRGGLDRSDHSGCRAVTAVPRQCPCCCYRRAIAADGGIVHFHFHARCRIVGQSDEPRRTGHCHRHPGRRRGGSDREYRRALVRSGPCSHVQAQQHSHRSGRR